MVAVGTSWRAYGEHGDVIRSFAEVGSFKFCPEIPKKNILKYLVMTFLGTRGGPTSYGNVREVFYSNSAIPLIEDIVSSDRIHISEELRSLGKDKDVKLQCQYPPIARRFESLLDLVDDD